MRKQRKLFHWIVVVGDLLFLLVTAHTTSSIPAHATAPPAPAQAAPQIAGCNIFPDDNIWKVRVDGLPRDPHSDAYRNTIGADFEAVDVSSLMIDPDSGQSPVGASLAVPPGCYPVEDAPGVVLCTALVHPGVGATRVSWRVPPPIMKHPAGAFLSSGQ